MKVINRVLTFFCITLPLFMITSAYADIYKIPESKNLAVSTPSQKLESKLKTDGEYDVQPIDSGYRYTPPTPSAVKTEIVNKNFVQASTTFTIGKI
ncbi:hypothetical protein OAO18_05035 [Francisellaceae bacterium]|nr:hypothetical protein [Francisellaceae bacterium]